MISDEQWFRLWMGEFSEDTASADRKLLEDFRYWLKGWDALLKGPGISRDTRILDLDNGAVQEFWLRYLPPENVMIGPFDLIYYRGEVPDSARALLKDGGIVVEH